MSRRRGTQHHRRSCAPPSLHPDAECGNCGRLLRDCEPHEGPTMSVDLGGQLLLACPDCVPCLEELVRQAMGPGGPFR